MAILKNNKNKKEEILPPQIPMIDVKKRCFFCNNEALFMGTFVNNWFNMPVLLCDNHLKKAMIDRNVELEQLDYNLPTFSDRSDEEESD